MFSEDVHLTVKICVPQTGKNLTMAVVQTAYANGSSTHYLEDTLKVMSLIAGSTFVLPVLGITNVL